MRKLFVTLTSICHLGNASDAKIMKCHLSGSLTLGGSNLFHCQMMLVFLQNLATNELFERWSVMYKLTFEGQTISADQPSHLLSPALPLFRTPGKSFAMTDVAGLGEDHGIMLFYRKYARLSLTGILEDDIDYR